VVRVKSSKLMMGCLAALGLTAGMASAQADVDRDAIAERLKPIGQLCLQGQDCGTPAADEAEPEEATDAAEAEANGNGLDGQALYASGGCAACHDSGAAGAPRLGNTDEWADRLEKGMDELYANSINGIGAMPPKGGNASLSDDEVNAIVDYMVAEVE